MGTRARAAGRLLDLGIQGAGLDDGQPGGRVDLDPAMRSVDKVMHPSTAAEPPESPVPAPRVHHRHPVGARPAQHGLHVGRARRPHHRQGLTGIGAVGAVEAIALDDIGIADQRAWWQVGCQLLQRVVPEEC